MRPRLNGMKLFTVCLQAVALGLTGMATLVTAAGGIELPRNVDAHTMFVLHYIDVLASQNVKQGTDFRIIDKIDIR